MPSFGSLLPGRQANSGDYKYGFNGKENDNEIKGTGNQQDYGFRIYDPRLGKFLSVDPLTKDYPWYTPYQFAGNMPIWAIDLDGAEPNLMHEEEGIIGVGNLGNYAGINVDRTQNFILKDKFVMYPVYNNAGQGMGWIAARIITRENAIKSNVFWTSDEKEQVEQDAYFVSSDKVGEFSKNIDDFYDYSIAAYRAEELWGDLSRNSFGQALFLLSASGKSLGALEGLSKNSLKNLSKTAGPKPSPKFKTPTNPPQLPPKETPENLTLRIEKPTEQYPNGYWRLEKSMPQGGSQGIDPSTLKPGAQHETHVPLPEGYWKK
jgi:RHS repeat-associated protein